MKFCKIPEIFVEIWRQFEKSAVSFENPQQIRQILQKIVRRLKKSQKSGMVQRKKCRAWKMLKNAALDAKIGVDTAENEPQKGSEKWGL